MVSNYFGYSDASDDEDLYKYFYRTPLFDQIKKGNKASGKFLVHGIKGAGKTAICNKIQAENASQLVRKIDKSFGFDVSARGKYAAPIESLMITLLLKEVINEIKTRASDFTNKQAVKKVDSLIDKLRGIFSQVISGTTVKSPIIEFDLEKIFTKKLDGFSQFKIDEYLRALEPALNEKQGYILVDDVDDVFTGADENAAFIEGLVRAAKEINKSFGKSLHCLIFLKSGLFKLFFENAKEYDKLRDFIVSISWGKEELAELLARRIRQKHNLAQTVPHWTAWQHEFEGSDQKQIEEIQSYIISRCVSGPRDLIVYCNMAKEEAGKDKIGSKHIKKVEDLYSKEKLYEINRDFGKTYPKISDLLQQAFAGESQTYLDDKLRKLLTEKILANDKIHQLFDKYEYILLATKESLMELLYGIGFLGFRGTKTSEVEFVMTNPEPGSKVLYTAYEYRIHDAYRQYLNLHD
jgi:hypothetical protein